MHTLVNRLVPGVARHSDGLNPAKNSAALELQPRAFSSRSGQGTGVDAGVAQLLYKLSAELSLVQSSWLTVAPPADWGRVGEGASLGQPQCSAATYGGNNFVQGAPCTPL